MTMAPAGADCPPWIDPGNAFRLVVKVAKYTADVEYGMVEMADQEHDLWLDRSIGYSLAQFHEDVATKIIWGPSQTLSIWVLDSDTGSEWKIKRDDHWQQMMDEKWNERMAKIAVEVRTKDGYERFDSSVPSKANNIGNPHVSGVASPPQQFEETVPVDWATLTILPDGDQDGEANAIVDEELVYEAMGFRAADERAEQAAREDIPIPVMNSDLQRDMAEAEVPVDDRDPSEPMYDWDRDNPDMSVGTHYPCMNDFRLAVKQHAIVNEFELGTEKSDKTRFRGYCSAAGCPWIIRARTQHDKSVRIQINKNQHNCASRSRVLGKMASIAWVAERAIPVLKKKPKMGAADVKEELEEKYKIKINYQTVWYGRQRASDKLFGKWSDSYDWLYRFKAEVELRAPGSIVEIDHVTVDGKVHFTRFFCAFKACIDGFINGCRPYISIDSTHLNGEWNGQLPAALALDGHNLMFPLAFGLFESETKDNWIWFMEQLRKAIGPFPRLAVCTDACKGLEIAVKEVFPWAEQRECFRHLMENMKKHFTGEVYGRNMWPAARAYSPHRFKYFFYKVLAASPLVQNWLDEHHNLLWARSKFSADIKCDYINNNLVECWNAWVKELKDLPPHCLVDAIREKLVVMFEKRRRISKALSPGLLPAVFHQLNAASKGLGHLKVTKGHDEQSEVTEIYKDEEVRRHVVYLPQKSCTCREWQVTGKPCPHALAVITTTRQPNMAIFVDSHYYVERFQAAYEGIVPNITDRNQWPEVNKGFHLDPSIGVKRGPGRQKKERIKPASERFGKATRQVKCKGCGESGHRQGSWRCELTGTKKRKRTKKNPEKAGRKKAKKGDIPAPEQATPRTRAAVAREAAVKARLQAEQAEARAREAMDAAEALTRAAIREVPTPLQIVLPPPSSPSGPMTRRRLSMVADEYGGPSLPDVQPEVVQPVVKKMTPKRKQLASKVRNKYAN